MRRLLFEGETPYLELADELYISDTQLGKLINRINRRMTQRYDYEEYPILKMSGKLVLKMTEQETRKYCLFYVASRTLKHYFDYKEYQPYFEYVDLEEMRELVLEELWSRACSYHDTAVMRLILHTTMVVERWSFGRTAPEKRTGETEWNLDRRPPSQETPDCLEVEWVLNHLKEMLSLDMEISSEECRNYEHSIQNDFYYEETENPEPPRELLHKILIEVNVEYGFDFSGNQEFCDEMATQLNGVTLQANKKQHVINPALGEIRSKYPLEYDIAIFLADRFHCLTGVMVNEDEVGQFAVHFIQGMESRFEDMQQKLVLINPYGKQTSVLMEKRFRKTTKRNPIIAYEYSVLDYPKQMPKDTVAVPSTIPLSPPPEDIPVVLCRNFLDYHGRGKLLTIIRDSRVSSIKSYFKVLFKPSLFFADMEFESRGAALSFMCGKSYEEGYVEEGFFESAVKREHIASTALEPGFTFSHGMENDAYRTTVCTYILKDKVSWGPYQVKIVFLSALISSWSHTIIPVHNVMIGHLSQTGTIYKLAKIKDCRELLDFLLWYSIYFFRCIAEKADFIFGSLLTILNLSKHERRET